jgi:hypothetical protein
MARPARLNPTWERAVTKGEAAPYAEHQEFLCGQVRYVA